VPSGSSNAANVPSSINAANENATKVNDTKVNNAATHSADVAKTDAAKNSSQDPGESAKDTNKDDNVSTTHDIASSGFGISSQLGSSDVAETSKSADSSVKSLTGENQDNNNINNLGNVAVAKESGENGGKVAALAGGVANGGDVGQE
jgi:hypothetical protein